MPTQQKVFLVRLTTTQAQIIRQRICAQSTFEAFTQATRQLPAPFSKGIRSITVRALGEHV